MKTKLLALILMVVLIVLSLVPAVHAETWAPYTIDYAAGAPTYLMVYDIDSDTNPDVVVASRAGNSVYWYKAPADPTGDWTRYTIGGLAEAYGVFVHDMDGDNYPDVVATGYTADEVVWYENPYPTIGGDWNSYTIGSADGAFCVYVADIDSDTNPDVVASAELGDEVAWFKAPSDPTQTPWTKYVIDSALDGARGIRVADMDGDGDLDVVAAAYRASDIILYARPTPPTTVPWPKYTIDPPLALLGASNVDVADIDGDGNPDVVATGMGANDIVWYKAPENPNQTWTGSKHWIDSDLYDAWGVHIYSIDGWSTLDVVATAYRGDVVVWYQGPADIGTNPDATWDKKTIGTIDGPRGVDVDDIDEEAGQGPDVVVSSWDTNDVVWYQSDWSGLWPIPEVPLGTILLLGTALLIPGAIAAAKRLRLNPLLRK